MTRLGAATALVLLVAAPLAGGTDVRTGGPTATQSAAGQQSLTAAELDLLLAPVALYPDSLLAQMLLAAATPDKLVEISAWLKKEAATLKGTELQQAAEAQGFPPPVVALALFPDVVAYMAGDVTWTTQLGQAFAGDRKAVLASIQRLRAQSQAAGTLKSTPQQQVENKTTEAGQQVIVIEPANPQVVYVPQYNPQTVYTQPSTTVVVEQDDDDDAVAAGVIGFAAGVAIGAAVDNDYYYGPYGWRGGAYMYNDAWDDWDDARDDARDDWQDHREDLVEERGDRAGEAQEQRTERQQTRQENRPETQAQAQERRAQAQSAAQTRSSGGTQEARGHSGQRSASSGERAGTSSDAFSGYSSGRSERAASSRGNRSRSSSGGGRSRRR